MRLAMLLLLGALLVMAAYRGRRLLVRALDEAEQRGALTRFLPAEIASLITDGAFGGGLLPGRRQLAAILFVDIRDSTARAENLDPVDLATFIASFRRCVTRAASEHGGVIDKFIGDGALVVFGLPEPRPDDATRALACARMLLSLIDRWNLERQLEPPVRVDRCTCRRRILWRSRRREPQGINGTRRYSERRRSVGAGDQDVGHAALGIR